MTMTTMMMMMTMTMMISTNILLETVERQSYVESCCFCTIS